MGIGLVDGGAADDQDLVGWSVLVALAAEMDDEPESLILAQSERWRNA